MAVICADTPLNCDAAKSKDFNLTATTKAFEAARVNAEKLAKELGKGWMGYVWENLGWHYKATSPNGFVAIYAHHRDDGEVSYSAEIHRPGEVGTPAALHEYGSSRKTPKQALSAAVRVARQHVNALAAIVQGAEACVS